MSFFADWKSSSSGKLIQGVDQFLLVSRKPWDLLATAKAA
jgi:hypothetical protein